MFDSTASGESLPIEPTGSSPLIAIGDMMNLDVFLRVAERLLAVEQRARATGSRFSAGAGMSSSLTPDALDPLGVGCCGGERVLQLLVVDDAALLEVDEEHLARLQAPLLDDLLLGDGRQPHSEPMTTRSSSVTM